MHKINFVIVMCTLNLSMTVLLTKLWCMVYEKCWVLFEQERIKLWSKQLTYLLTYLLTPWSRVLENLTGCQLVKKFRVFTSAHHLSLSWARSNHSIPAIPLPEDPSWYYSPIYAWVFQVDSFPQISPPEPCIHLSSHPCMLHASPISFSVWWHK